MFSVDDIQQNVPLSSFATFRIGGAAKYFLVVKTREELIKAVKWARENDLSYFVLGGGSNILISEKGFSGLVIKNESNGLKIGEMEDGKLKVKCDSGVMTAKIVFETTKLGYSGAEWGFGIPGTIGGAICGNAGRLGRETSQSVESVTMLGGDLSEKEIAKSECGFEYRSSRFKKNQEIVLGAELEFVKKSKEEINSVLNEAKEIVRQGAPFPSAGCAFKNYVVRQNDPLLLNHPDLNEKVRGGKIGVGFLIDQSGLKGRKIGGARIWEGHANYIVNAGGAKSGDVLELIKLAKEKVKEKFGIELEEEIRVIK